MLRFVMCLCACTECFNSSLDAHTQLEGSLNCNVVFLFEGEEEAHSDGFQDALQTLMLAPPEESGLTGAPAPFPLSCALSL